MMNQTLHLAKQQIVVPSTPQEVWHLLTEPEKLKQWFADVECPDANEAIICSFGDGDFFAVRVETLNAPRHLGIVWKFMGLGPSYEIDFFLSANPGGTQVMVEDRGALTDEEAASLTLGWQDFLERLQRFAVTGQNSRYQWSNEISITADLGSDKDPFDSFRFINQNRSHYFPVSAINPLKEETIHSQWSIKERHWAGETKATASLQESGAKNYLTVTHQGWEGALPAPENISARRWYARMWRELLLELEAQYQSARPPVNSSQ